jgi:hypothetical protein
METSPLAGRPDDDALEKQDCGKVGGNHAR